MFNTASHVFRGLLGWDIAVRHKHGFCSHDLWVPPCSWCLSASP